MDSKEITDSKISTGGGTGNATMGSGGVQPSLSDSLPVLRRGEETDLAFLPSGEGSSSAVGQLGNVNSSEGADWTENLITVLPGEDAVQKILQSAPSYHNGICILSGSGSASFAWLQYRPDRPATTLGAKDSSFEILKLSGLFTFTEDGNRANRTGGLTVEIMTPDGKKGGKALELIAHDPIEVVLGSFCTGDQVRRLNSQQQQEVVAARDENTMVVPPWLENLVKTQFFNHCHYCQKRKSNMFCFHCNNVPAFCSRCQPPEHNNHRVLQIWRYHGRDSVRESEIEQDFELNDVQTFRVNEQNFVYINQRPNQEGRRQNMYAVVCENCHFTLTSIPTGFCSLGCKVEGMKKRNVDNAEVEEGNGGD